MHRASEVSIRPTSSNINTSPCHPRNRYIANIHSCPPPILGNLSSALLNKQLMKDTHNDNSEAAISVVVDIQVRTCDADMANISRFVRKLWGVILASIPPNLLVSLRTALQMLDLFHLETCFVDPRRWYQPGGIATSFVDARLRTALAKENVTE
jgi:hypothetical protein